MARTKSNYVLEGTLLQSDNILPLLLRNSDNDDQEAKKLGCGGRSLLYFHPSLLREKDTKTTIPSLASHSAAGRPAGLSAQSVRIANDLCALLSFGKLSTFVS